MVLGSGRVPAGRGNNWNRSPGEAGGELQRNPGGCWQRPDFIRGPVLRKESPPRSGKENSVFMYLCTFSLKIIQWAELSFRELITCTHLTEPACVFAEF